MILKRIKVEHDTKMFLPLKLDYLLLCV